MRGTTRAGSAWLPALAVTGGVALVGLALRSDLAATRPDATSVVADLATGVAFLVAGAAYRGRPLPRLLLAGVGAAWLLGSVLPAAAGVHQGVLLLALVTAGGLNRPWAGLLAVADAVLVAAGGLAQPVVAAAFLVAGALLALTRRPLRRRTWVPLLASVGMTLCLVGLWWSATAFPAWNDPPAALLVYETTLVLVAVVLPVDSRVASAASAATPLTGRLLADAGESGVEGLSRVLADTLRDPSVRVLRAREDGRYDAARLLVVEDGGRPVAVVAHGRAPLDDPSTRSAVSTAVRLTLAHDDLRAEQGRQLDALRAARARILAAADRQRARAAATLREDVLTIDGVHAEVAALAGGAFDPDDPVAVAAIELAAASGEILGLVAGVPPVPLGHGRLGEAIAGLAARATLPVRVDVASDASASSATETTAYFVCAETLTNANKHAGPSRVTITVRLLASGLEVAVVDDGSGGADPSGRGLAGLADRVAAVGGRLRVESSHGAGTTVTAVLPVT